VLVELGFPETCSFAFLTIFPNWAWALIGADTIKAPAKEASAAQAIDRWVPRGDPTMEVSPTG
jgi:hypothetical protein